MEKQKYVEDIEAIKDIMDRSTKFLSLSGISGVMAGCFALIAAYLAYETIYSGQDYMEYRKAELSISALYQLLTIAISTIVLSVVVGLYFTTRKARQLGQSIYDKQARLLLINLAIPLVTGGVLCLMLLLKGAVALVAPLTLLFYGLALVNASKYTVQAMQTLGLIEIGLGLLSVWFLGYGLIFWAIGFGVMHIVYGVVMHLNDRP